jgi:hypothetical protein
MKRILTPEGADTLLAVFRGDCENARGKARRTHHDPTLHARPASHYGLHSAKDAAVVLLSVLALQALMLETARRKGGMPTQKPAGIKTPRAGR